MAETQVRVYRTLEEERADSADAAMHGWTVVTRDPLPDGTTRVTFTQAGRAWQGGVVGPAPANDLPRLGGLVFILILVVVVGAVVFSPR